jgi:hypothetical protein
MLFAFLLFFFLLTSNIYSNPSDIIAAQYDSVITFDSIKNELSSDGEWIKVKANEIDSESVTDGSKDIDDDINTEYVWRPNNVDENWSPYTNGYWTYTNCGWMWNSCYRWGWRPYHYGRWWWSPEWGWVWSPGYVWAPAWVVWMFYGDYCAWYPLSPRARRHHRHHHDEYTCHHIRYRVKHWLVCARENFPHTIIDPKVIIDPVKVPEILQNSAFTTGIQIESGIVTNKGPNVTDIEKSTGQKLNVDDVTKYNNVNEVSEKVSINKETGKKETRVEDVNTDKRKYNPNDGVETKTDGTKEENYGEKNKNYDGEKQKEKPRDDGSYDKQKEKPRNDGNYEKQKESPKNHDGNRNEQKKEAPKNNNDGNSNRNDNNNKGNDGMKKIESTKEGN